MEDVSYQNACKNADRDNALLEGESAVRRAAAEIQDTGFMRMYYDTPDFHDRLHREILEETYPILMQNAQEQRIDAMLAFAEQVAKESAVESYERFSVIETEDGFAVWDNIRDEIYVDDDGVSQEFGDRQQANDYLEQVRRDVSAKESAEWRYMEQVKQEALSDRTFAEEHLIPEETMFNIGNQPYMVDRVDWDSLTVHYQHIGVIVPEGEEIFHSAPVSVVRRYMEIDDIKIDLTDEQQTIVEAFETGGFIFNPFPGSEIRFDDAEGYPMTYKTWEDAHAAIDSAELRDFPGLREEVQRILHPDRPVNGMTAPDRFSIREMPDEDGIFGIWDAALDRFYAEGNQILRMTERENAEEYLSNILRIHGIVPQEPQEAEQPEFTTKTVAVYPGEENRMPFDVVIQTIRAEETKEIPPENFRITNDDLGTGGAKAKFRMNMDAINTLKQIEAENRHATPEEQEVLSKYVGWGGLADAFDDSKENWKSEYAELSAALTPDEYTAARSSTLNAHYTSPTVIKAIYEAVGNMGFTTGNVLEPAMGVGNFFGLLPEEMSGSKLYGVELDSITGRIAKQLYPNADITVAGFETTDRRDFFDLAMGNVPFGQYKVNDKAYNKLGFSIHDYFFAKTLDQVRPGGVIAFVTSRYTMDKQSPEVRKYIAERADLLGAIRLPNNAFKANAGTEVVSDILFLKKRDRPQVLEPDWVNLGQNSDGFAINSYFVEHPEMILGRQSSESTQYGHQDFTVEPIEGAKLANQLHEAVQHIHGQYQEAELPDLGENEAISKTLPADPNVKNYSYTVVDGEVYYRENSIMVQPELNATAKERVKGMVELRDCVHDLIDKQLYGADDAEISQAQERLNQLYDDFSAKYGLINDRPNRAAFAEDSSYYLLCSLEILDEEHHLKQKADMFTKRTIMPNTVVTSVDTAAEALAVSIAEKAKVDMAYMSELTGKTTDELAADLRGVIFQIPEPAKSDGSIRYVTADEYLSGNVREKLRIAEAYAADNPAFAVNVEVLTSAQPKKLEAHEIDVRLGATWIDKAYIQQFMFELLNPAFYNKRKISVNYSEVTAEWNITGK
ncbi:MAG: helicase SNF2, partial [Clostridia bacterium]|nr:helicase SNF2 [Clostridia bacterium]